MSSRLFELLPKLLDVLPHLERFSSLADRVLSTRAASDAAMTAIAEGVRSDIAQVSTTQAALSQQVDLLGTQVTSLNTQITGLSTHINTVGDTAADARSAATALGKSLVTLDREVRSLRSLVVATLVLIVALVLMVGWLLLTRTR